MMHAPLSLLWRKRIALILLLCIPAITWCQTHPPVIHFKTGNIAPRILLRNIDAADPAYASCRFDGKVYLFVQFKKIPVASVLQQLNEAGIQLLQYIPDNTYLVSVNRPVAKAVLQQLGIINLRLYDPSDKLAVSLRSTGNTVNSRAITNSEVVVSCYDNIADNRLLAAFGEQQIHVSAQLGDGIFKVAVAPAKLYALAQLPFVAFIEPVSPPPDTLNSRSGIVHGSHLLQGNAFGVGRNLSGKGVVVGVGDISGTANHVDHAYKTYEGNGSATSHGTHVAGTLAGAGLINPRLKGNAPGATLITDVIENIISRTPDYYDRFGMVLTNNSYGGVPGSCSSTGGYSYLSRMLDRQLLQFPDIMHVFAAGNSGDKLCAPYPIGYKSLAADQQAAKNVITVAGDDIIGMNYYSKGPASDGRLKPEIAALGFSVHSTVLNNRYGVNYGTSMAAPQVTGMLALMYERYRQLNNNQNPPGALMKAIICNAATDMEVPGPDFSHGFGWLNGLPAIDMIEQKQYLHDSLAQGQEKTFTIEAKTGAHELKVMLYWHDIPPSYYSFSTLINDFDITVTTPDGTVYRPLVADTLDVRKAAVQREDHVNNMEQVVVRDPVPGQYTVKIKGFALPFGRKDFFVAYYQSPKGFRVIYPTPGETWKGNEVQVVSWQDPGAEPSAYQVDASSDNGLTWQPAGTASAGWPGHLSVTVLNTITRAARMRVTNLTTGQQAVSEPFMIAPEVDFSLASLCDGTARVSWNAIPSVDSMEVSMVQNGTMQRIGITIDQSFLVRRLSNDSVYWITVRPYALGAAGERSIAKAVQTTSKPCSLPELNGDIRLEEILAPSSGRKFTSTTRSSSEAVTVRIKNLDAASTSMPIVLKVYLNQVLWTTETVTATIAANGTYDHTFTRRLDCSSFGKYLLRVEAEKADDPYTINNTITKLVKTTDNPVITLPFIETFSGLKDTAYRYPDYFGLEGAETWDLATDRGTRLIVPQGDPALAPDKDGNLIAGALFQTYTGTFNLSAYAPQDVILLSFGKAAGYLPNGKTLYVRGADHLSWIQVPLPYSNLVGYGTRDINLTRILAGAGQTVGPSTQIRWQQNVTTFYNGAKASHLDDVELYMVKDDIQCTAIKTDTLMFWAKSTIPAKVQVANNHSQPVSNIKVSLQLPNGTIMQDTITAINGYDTVYKSFIIPPLGNLPDNNVVLKAWATSVTDSYHSNDTGTLNLIVYPVINSFPYVESFEEGRKIWSPSPLYNLVEAGEGQKVKKAANGTRYWYMMDVDSLSFPSTVGAIFSNTGFDLSGMTNPYISLSLSENLRPGIDFMYARVSFTQGRTFQVLLDSAKGINWYKDPRGWSDTAKTYWHVVSSPLPKKDSIMLLGFTIRFSPSVSAYNPFVHEGPALDEIHIYDRPFPLAESVTVPQTGSQAVNGNQWTHLQQNNFIIASINANDQDLGTVSFEQLPVYGDHKILDGYKVLNRRWIIRSSKTPDKPVLLRLYFSDAEANQLRLTDSCHGCDPDTISAYDFGVYQYHGPSSTINALLHDNVSGAYTLTNAAGFMLLPYDKGYYAELPVWPNSEFYLMIPERYSLPPVQWTAAADNTSHEVQLNWQVSDQSAISRYVLERAAGDADYDNGIFTELDVQTAAGNGQFQYTDRSSKTDDSYYYRLRLEYKNGYYRYTDTKVAGFGKTGAVLVYPNPSHTGLFNVVVPARSAGTHWQLSNSLGQQLMAKYIPPAGSIINVPVDLSLPRYANGVYFLKITSGNDVQVLRLMKMK